MSKDITIVFGTDGHAVIEANGFKGVGCKDATKQLELVLAGNNADNKDSKPKPDFYATNTGAATIANR